jgi:hypothetical protein
MNCAFEDCSSLAAFADEEIKETGMENVNWENVFQKYQENRKINADAIAGHKKKKKCATNSD